MNEYENEIKNSIELDIIDTTKENNSNKEILNDKSASLLNNNEETKENKIDKRGNRSNLLYGNDIKIMNPKKLGKTWAFLYYNDNPLIVIGPDCK